MCAKSSPLLRSSLILIVLLGDIIYGVLLFPASGGQRGLRPIGLKCDWQLNPIAIMNAFRPQLDWILASLLRIDTLIYQTG